MKIQSLISSLERKVKSARVPIRTKPSYAIPPPESSSPSKNQKETADDLKESKSDCDSFEYSSLSIASDISSEGEAVDRDDPQKVMKKSKPKKSKKPSAKAPESSEDSNVLSESDLDVLNRHEHWERGLSQASKASFTQETLYSQKSSQAVSKSQPKSQKTDSRRRILHDDFANMDASQADPIESIAKISKDASQKEASQKSNLSQCESQNYLLNRKRTWEIRSLNPENSQHITTSNYVMQELEKSVSFHPPLGDPGRFPGFGSVSFHSSSQCSSIPFNDSGMRLFKDSFLKGEKSPRKKSDHSPPSSIRESVAEIKEKHRKQENESQATQTPTKKSKPSEAPSPGKIKFPKNFEDE